MSDVWSGPPLRIAHVIWSLGLGGAEQVAIRLASGLDRTRFAPLVCCLDAPGPFAGQAEAEGLEVVALGKRGPLDLRALLRLRRLLGRRAVDVVHTHLWGADLWGRLAARLAGTRGVVTTAHNVDTWKRGYHLAIDRHLAAWTTRLVAVSEEVRRFYEDRGVGRDRWQVVYNGVAVAPVRRRERGTPLRSLGIEDGDRVVAFVGRLVPAKAPGIFLDAVAEAARTLPSVKALVVGDGPLRAALEAQAGRLGLAGRAVFTGLRRDVAEILAGVDVLAFSSEREGLSMAMLEAMAAGVPVVATRVGGTPELIESGVTGVLVPAGRPDALAEGILGVLRSPGLGRELGRAAQARVRERFSLAGMVAAYQGVYEEIAGRWVARSRERAEAATRAEARP